MSLHVSRSRAPRRKGQPAIRALPAILNDLQVLRFREWTALAGISPRTGKRLIAAGHGPAVTRLSERRIGISVGAHKEWLASRERAS